jgi:hypothetical protein
MIRNPVPDPNWPTNPTINAAFTIGAGVVVLVGLVLAFRYWRREGTLVGFACIAGAAIASLTETITAANAYVYYPVQGQWTVFTAYGVKIPLFLTLSYIGEVGLGAMATWRALKAGGGPGVLLRIWLVVAVTDIVFETVALWLNVFYYYGPQPLNPWRMPLYWGFMDGALGLLPGVLAYLLLRGRTGPVGWLAYLAVFPAALMFVYVGTGWPIWITMHTDLPMVWIQLAGLLSVVLVYLYVRAVAALATLPPEVADGLRRNRSDLGVRS